MPLKVSLDYIINVIRGYSILSDYTDRQHLETIYQGTYEDEEDEDDEEEDEEDEDTADVEEDTDGIEQEVEEEEVEEEEDDEDEEDEEEDEDEDEGKLGQPNWFNNTNRIPTQGFDY